jgi:biopolymer transport protein ExbD
MPARKLEWKRVKESRGGSDSLLITPLIDIMFLILIFFVMNTSFNRFSPMEINLPESSTALGNVEENLTITLYETEIIKLGESQIPLNELSLKLAPLTKDYNTVIIAGDQTISYAFLVSVMDEISKSGFVNMTLVTESQ